MTLLSAVKTLDAAQVENMHPGVLRVAASQLLLQKALRVYFTVTVLIRDNLF